MKLRDTIKYDYNRLFPVRGGYLRRILLCPTFNLVFWFRLLTYLREKGGICRIFYALLCFPYKWKCAKLGIDLRIGTKIGKGLCFAHCGGIVINASSEIGENCLVFHDVTIGGMLKDGVMHVPSIGNNAVLFAGAKIIGDVKIGDNVIIGANAVVTHDVADNAVAAGVPAKIISMNGKEISMQYYKGKI